MEGCPPTRPRDASRLRARLERWLPATGAAWLATATAALASTGSGSSSSGPDPTLLIAAIVGGAIGAVWLLKPSGRPRPPAAAPQPRRVEHARPLDKTERRG